MVAFPTDETEFASRVLTDLSFAASVSEDLMQRSTALRQLLTHGEVTKKMVEDPVFFAVVMCGDKWLVDASAHQKRYLRGKNVYKHQQLELTIPAKFKDIVEPFMYTDLKIEARREGNNLIIEAKPIEKSV